MNRYEINEHDGVEVTKDVPEKTSRPACVEQLFIFFKKPGLAYEIGFSDEHCQTVAQEPLLTQQIKS